MGHVKGLHIFIFLFSFLFRLLLFPFPFNYTLLVPYYRTFRIAPHETKLASKSRDNHKYHVICDFFPSFLRSVSCVVDRPIVFASPTCLSGKSSRRARTSRRWRPTRRRACTACRRRSRASPCPISMAPSTRCAGGFALGITWDMRGKCQSV